MKAALLLALVATAAAAQGKIHGDPAKPQPGFKPHQLSFETPPDGVARDEFRSAPFYAVILKGAPPCAAAQRERAEIQPLFPANKVFAYMPDCGDDEDTISYTHVTPRIGFIAIYAGDTEQQGQAFLATVKETGRFPGANLRRMQAMLVYP